VAARWLAGWHAPRRAQQLPYKVEPSNTDASATVPDSRGGVTTTSTHTGKLEVRVSDSDPGARRAASERASAWAEHWQSAVAPGGLPSSDSIESWPMEVETIPHKLLVLNKVST